MIKTVFIIGPTGIGKTEYAINYALQNHGKIVSADSMQIYKYLDIGSAKPTKEERSKVEHFLVDEIDPRYPFSVFEYQKLAKKYIQKISEDGYLPIVCGGTGLYIHSLVYDMDFSAPEGNDDFRQKIFKEEQGDCQNLWNRLRALDEKAAQEIHPNNVKRVLRAIERLEKGEQNFSSFSEMCKPSKELDCEIIKLEMDRERLYERINKRVDKLYDAGLENEVKSLLKMGFSPDDFSMKGIGYKEIMDALASGNTAESAKDLIKQNTRHYAKRQITWFKRYTNAEIINV